MKNLSTKNRDKFNLKKEEFYIVQNGLIGVQKATYIDEEGEDVEYEEEILFEVRHFEAIE